MSLALRFESSYDRAFKELKQLQTNRALQDPSAPLPPLADPLKVQQFVNRTQSRELRELKVAAASMEAQAQELVVESLAHPRTPAPQPQHLAVQHFAKQSQFEKPQPAVSTKVGRNEPCPCGSTLKYKRCCGKVAAA